MPPPSCQEDDAPLSSPTQRLRARVVFRIAHTTTALCPMFFSQQVSEDNIMQVWLMAENIYNDQEIDVSEAELEGSQ